jgi:hypothetical protein
MTSARAPSSRRVPRDPRKPLPGEWSPARQRRLMLVGGGIVAVGLGTMLGSALTPEASAEARHHIAELEAKLTTASGRVAELERTLAYQAGQSEVQRAGGRLKPEDRERHERDGRRYAQVLRAVKAQGAADLMTWFVKRWDGLLDQPEANDRTGRRAELLGLLVGGMAANLDPKDYVPWQAEFLNGTWLGELHFDLDGDGLPGKRSMPNTHDGFVDASVCQIAMALNQAVRDARVLVMPDMRCDRPEAKMSVFLQGTTYNDALDNFVRALREAGFIAVERIENGIRLILVGLGSRGQKPQP